MKNLRIPKVIKSKQSNVECVLKILHSVFILTISKYLTLLRRKKKCLFGLEVSIFKETPFLHSLFLCFQCESTGHSQVCYCCLILHYSRAIWYTFQKESYRVCINVTVDAVVSNITLYQENLG